MKDLDAVSFPTRTISHIATFFLQQKLAHILDEENAIKTLQSSLSKNSIPAHTKGNIATVMLIAGEQVKRIKKVAEALEISLRHTHPVSNKQSDHSYLRAVNEDTLYGEILSSYARRQSHVVCYYEEALNFAKTMGNYAVEELLAEALSAAKKSDFIFKRAGLRLVTGQGHDLFAQRAVMT